MAHAGADEPAIRSADVDASIELLSTHDAKLTEATVGTELKGAESKFTLSVTSGRVAIDFGPAPVDLISTPVSRVETRTAFGATGRWQTEPVGLFGGGGAYRGFTDFRSVWLAEYYRQLFEPVPGYLKADPRGWHALAGGRWAYIPLTGYLQIVFVRQQDRISPGYEPQIRAPLLRGREHLATNTLKISTENVLTPSVRTLFEASATEATGRENRFSLQGSCNWAVAEDYTLRAVVAGVRERPEFEAFSGAFTVERDWDLRWFAGLTLRAYRDNGEVVDPLLVSTAAPSLKSLHAAASLRWQGKRFGLRFEAGPYRTRYGALPAISTHFSRLYSDRNWLRLQFTGTRQF